MRRLGLVLALLGASLAGAQTFRTSRAPGNFTGSDVTGNSFTASSTGSAFVAPVGGKTCFNGASCTEAISSDGSSVIVTGALSVSTVSASGASTAASYTATGQVSGATLKNANSTWTVDSSGNVVSGSLSASTVTASTSVQTPQLTATIIQQAVIPRHRYIGPLIRQAIIKGSGSFRGPYVGNSIMAGSGSSGGSNIIPFVVGTTLQAAIGTDTTNSWSGRPEGVGGTTTADALAYLSDTYDNASGRPTRGAPFSDPYICILDLRNDVSLLTVQQSSMLLRLVLQHAKRKGVDAVVVIDPPNVDAGFHILDTQANFGNWADAWRQVAADEGATLVDSWRAFYLLDQARPGILSTYYPAGGGVHPNDAGHAYIGSLIAQAMLAPSQGYTGAFGGATGDLDVEAISSWTSTAGITSLSSVTGLSSATTSRMVQTGEGSAQGYVLSASGNSVTIPNSVPAQYVLITAMKGPAYSGTFTAQYNFVNLNAGAAYTTAGSSTVQEFTYVAPVWSTAAAGQVGSTVITWASGTVSILGVTVIGECLTGYSDGAWPNVAETGTWSDATIASLYGARSSATVGDTDVFTWYGSTFQIGYERSTSQGKFTWSTDGGGATTVDAYLNASAILGTATVGQGLTEGWHTTTVTIATKNASSSGNTVKFGRVSQYDHAPEPAVRFVPLAVGGTTLKLRDRWTRATIDHVLSGAPYINQWVVGQSTLALSGTGSALVRLER
jgi:hypothetical protein